MTGQVIQFPIPPAFRKAIPDQSSLIDLPIPAKDERPVCLRGLKSSVRWGNDLYCGACALEFLNSEGETFFADTLHTREMQYVKEYGDLEMQLRASLQEMRR